MAIVDIEFVLATDGLNDHGGRTMLDGMDLKRFKSNPIMLYNHDEYGMMPIGRWTSIGLKKVGSLNALTAKPDFDETDPKAMAVKSKVEQKMIKAASIGARPVEFSTDPKLMIKGQTHSTMSKSELYEASIVPLPSDPKAVTLQNEGSLIRLTKGESNDWPKLEAPAQADGELAHVQLSADQTTSEPSSDDVVTLVSGLRESLTSLAASIKEMFTLGKSAKETEKEEAPKPDAAQAAAPGDELAKVVNQRIELFSDRLKALEDSAKVQLAAERSRVEDLTIELGAAKHKIATLTVQLNAGGEQGDRPEDIAGDTSGSPTGAEGERRAAPVTLGPAEQAKKRLDEIIAKSRKAETAAN